MAPYYLGQRTQILASFSVPLVASVPVLELAAAVELLEPVAEAQVEAG